MPTTHATRDAAPIKPARFERRKEEILNAAGATFNRHGLRDATLAVIAGEIGLNLKSLRYYFERREDLVAAAFMRSIALHQALIQDALEEDGIEARIRRFVRDYFELLADVRAGRRPEFVYFGDLRALAPPHAEPVWGAYGRMFRSIRQLFRSPGIEWDRERLNASAHMLLSQLLWSVVWVGESFPQDAPHLAAHVSDILLHGIAAAEIALPRFARAGVSAPVETDRLSQAAFLRTATALINRLGYRGASVDRISAELNVTKGAFYHYNETRDALVVACFEHTFAQLREAQDWAIANAGDGLSRAVAAAVSLVERQMLDEGTLLRTSALTAIGPELRARMAKEMSRLTLRFEDMLNDGLIDGSVRRCHVRIAAEMLTATINSAEELGRWVRSASVENAASLHVGPLLSGLLAASG